jgi:glycosyltransferase involved in cell wall biosynthesis
MAKPVVASEEILDHREILEQSGGGILVPFTPEAFAKAIIYLLDNPAQAAEMGKRGREWVKQNRSYEILGRQLEQYYVEVINAHD